MDKPLIKRRKAGPGPVAGRTFAASLLILLLLLSGSFVAAQQTYIVTKTVDSAAGGCQVGDCSLRSAIQAANSDGQASIIKFNFATGTAPYTIFVRGSALPTLTNANTVIDGLLDNSYDMGDVRIDGSLLAGTVNGLNIAATGTEIYGLQIQNFSGNGIQAGATFAAITIAIGVVGKGNIIINNGGSGFSTATQLNAGLAGNYIGTDLAFTAGLGNGARGIAFNSFATEGPPILIVDDNVIGGNATGGVFIDGRTIFTISDNIIGTNAAANANLGTGSSGITILDNTGAGTISNNIIGFSGRGISVDAATTTNITENSIFCNSASGITRNGNTIQIAITDADVFQVSGTSNAEGGRVEVFLQDLTGCGAGTPCQGKTFLGSATVSGGAWSLDVSGQVDLGDVVTATATLISGPAMNTSPFAACEAIGCPTISANIDETPSCVAANSGSLTANPSGGVAPYRFSWSTGATTATISNLPPGTFSVTIVDANTCRVIDSGTVAEVEGPAANAGADQTICNGGSATLTATATGGLGPYVFNWGAAGSGPTVTVSPDATTTFTVTVTDSGGCSDTDQVIVNVVDPPAPDAGADQALCAGETATLQGAIDGDPSAPGVWSASVAGGVFSPDANTLNATYTAPAGVASVTLTLTTNNAAGGCPEQSDEMTITYEAAPVVDAGPDQTICDEQPATLQGTIDGNPAGSGTWSASVPGGTFAPNATTLNATYTPPAGATEVTLTLTANNTPAGCPEQSDEMTITYLTSPAVDAGPDQSLCNGQAATLQGTIDGSTTAPGVWSASVTGGAFSPNANTLNASYTPPAGVSNVTLTLTASNTPAGCPEQSDEMTITYVAGPTVDAGPDQTLCTGSPATLQGVIGGTGGPGGWTASVPGGSFSPNAQTPTAVYTPPVGIAGVVLTLTAVDATGPGGCPSVQDQMTITYTGSGATAEAGPDQTICAGESASLAGAVGGSAAGGQWSTAGDGSFSDAAALNATYTPGSNDIANQSVVLTLTTDAAGGCPTANDAVTIDISPLPDYTVNGTDPSTCGDPDGNFMISGLNPGEAYEVTYVFAGATVNVSQDASTVGTITVDNLGPGAYTQIIVTNDAACSGPPLSVELNSPDGPQLSIDANPICMGSTSSAFGQVSGGAPPYSHQWIDQGSGSASGYTLSNTTTDELIIDATSAQAGSIDLLYQVTDSDGCAASLSRTLVIAVLPQISGVQLDSASSAGVADGQIRFEVSEGLGPYTYSWTGPSTGSATLAAAGTATIPDLLPGQYSLQLADANGCLSSIRFRIGITPPTGGGCTSDAGSLQAASPGGLQFCSSATARLVHNGDQTLDANDALVFVLKAVSGAIVKVNTIPEFDFDPSNMTLNTIYSAAARAGNAAGGGTVDPADPCLDESNAVEIIFRESLTGVLNFLQGEDVLCQGEELVLSTNDLGPVDYFWVTPNRDTLFTNEPMVVLPDIQPEDAGEYFVIARNGDCLNDQTGPFELIVNGLPAGTPICAGDDQVVCERTANLQACDPGPGSGVWTSLSGAKITNAGSATTTATELAPGENLFVWTVNIPDCGGVGSDTVRILYENALFAQPDLFVLERANTEIFMDVLKNDNIAATADFELTALTQPGFGILQTLSNGFRFYETEMRRGTVEFVYQICYFGGTCAGACDTATVRVEVLNLPYLPEGITPDGDGQNDELQVLGYTPGDSELRLELTIVNQWGEVVFHANDYTASDPWKGTFKGQPVPQGAYYCHMKTILPEGEFERTQTVYIVR